MKKRIRIRFTEDGLAIPEVFADAEDDYPETCIDHDDELEVERWLDGLIEKKAVSPCG